MCEARACCMDCGLKYGDEHGFPDLVVPDDVWKIISPGGHEGGLLCPSCLCRRAHNAGVTCEARFTSGPFAVSTPAPQEKHPDCEDKCQLKEHKGYHDCSRTGRCEYAAAQAQNKEPK